MSPSSPSLVSTDWLNDHLGDSEIRIVDASWFLPDLGRSGRQEYRAEHIPGAIFFDIDAIVDPASSLPHTMPSPADFAAAVGAMGIGNRHHIITYDALGIFSSARVWWAFATMGADRVSVLDGGLPKWRAEKRPLTADLPAHAPAHFTPTPDFGAVASLNDVSEASASGSVQIVDARPQARFRGEAPEPRKGVRSGHIPGSLNLPFDRLLNDGTLRSAADIRQAFEAAGADLGRPIMTSCGSGVTAAILTLALDQIGVRAASLYDGSWSEWGGHEDTAVATMHTS